jgi:hypothetical protein
VVAPVVLLDRALALGAVLRVRQHPARALTIGPALVRPHAGSRRSACTRTPPRTPGSLARTVHPGLGLLELITWISTHSHALSGLHTQARISLASCSRWMQTEDKHIRHSRTHKKEHTEVFYAAHQRTHKHFSSLHAL